MSKLCFRADRHDYRRPGFYMLTLKKGEGVGAFSEVVREGADRFTTRLFPVGEIIRLRYSRPRIQGCRDSEIKTQIFI